MTFRKTNYITRLALIASVSWGAYAAAAATVDDSTHRARVAEMARPLFSDKASEGDKRRMLFDLAYVGDEGAPRPLGDVADISQRVSRLFPGMVSAEGVSGFEDDASFTDFLKSMAARGFGEVPLEERALLAEQARSVFPATTPLGLRRMAHALSDLAGIDSSTRARLVGFLNSRPDLDDEYKGMLVSAAWKTPSQADLGEVVRLHRAALDRLGIDSRHDSGSAFGVLLAAANAKTIEGVERLFGEVEDFFTHYKERNTAGELVARDLREFKTRDRAEAFVNLSYISAGLRADFVKIARALTPPRLDHAESDSSYETHLGTLSALADFRSVAEYEGFLRKIAPFIAGTDTERAERTKSYLDCFAVGDSATRDAFIEIAKGLLTDPSTGRISTAEGENIGLLYALRSYKPKPMERLIADVNVTATRVGLDWRQRNELLRLASTDREHQANLRLFENLAWEGKPTPNARERLEFMRLLDSKRAYDESIVEFAERLAPLSLAKVHALGRGN